jgi:hypothetical protein
VFPQVYPDVVAPFRKRLRKAAMTSEGLWAVVAVLPRVRMQALIFGAQVVKQLQLPVAFKALIIPLHHE